MAALSVNDIKNYLRVTGSADDSDLGAFITASNIAIKTQTGKNYTKDGTDIATDELFKTAQRQIIATWHANREEAVAGSFSVLPHAAEAIVDIIKASTNYVAEAPEDDEDADSE